MRHSLTSCKNKGPIIDKRLKDGISSEETLCRKFGKECTVLQANSFQIIFKFILHRLIIPFSPFPLNERSTTHHTRTICLIMFTSRFSCESFSILSGVYETLVSDESRRCWVGVLLFLFRAREKLELMCKLLMKSLHL